MQNELIDFLTDLDRCSDQTEVWEVLTRASLAHGFDISIFAKIDQIENTPPVCLHNYPNGWKEYYAERKYFKYDAFYLHSLKSTLPITLDNDKKKSHLTWGETGKDILNEVSEAGLKRALFVPMLNEKGIVAGSITFGTGLMTTPDFEHALSEKFPVFYGIALSAYNKFKSFENSTENLHSLKITPRQYAVLKALSRGQTNKQIANELNITVVTVSHHLKELQKNMGVSVNRQILPKAYSLGLVK